MLDPEEEGTESARPGDGAGDSIAHVVHHQQEGDEKTKSARHNWY